MILELKSCRPWPKRICLLKAAGVEILLSESSVD